MRRVFIVISFYTLCLACGMSENSSPTEKFEVEPDYSLKLGGSLIDIDSTLAYVMYNEELGEDVITCKIYCTSGYPTKPKWNLNKKRIMYITAQAKLSTGKHLINKSGENWINLISYQCSNITVFNGNDYEGKKHWIFINSIDKDSQTISFEVHTVEYISLEDKITGKTDNIRNVTFIGKRIPYSK